MFTQLSFNGKIFLMTNNLLQTHGTLGEARMLAANTTQRLEIACVLENVQIYCFFLFFTSGHHSVFFYFIFLLKWSTEQLQII